MKLALLGVDEEALALVGWAVAHGGHQLIAGYDLGPRATVVTAVAPRVTNSDTWEELLLGRVADAVIVGRGGAGLTQQTGIADAERRADQLRKLAQAAIPMIVVCPACEAIVGFEVEMIRHDVGGIIKPFVPGAHHAAFERLEALDSRSDSQALGEVQQVLLERDLDGSNREFVLAQVARDVALLRRLIGNITAVTATGPARPLGRDPLGPKPAGSLPLANLSIHFTGAEGRTARWSLLPSSGTPNGQLRLIFTNGTALLTMPPSGHWSLAIPGGERSVSVLADDSNQEYARLFDHLATNDEHQESAWLSACRDQEVAEAVDRSLARGRTIELFNEEHTEEASFKGVMAMGGCLLLMIALAGVLVATLVDSLRLPLRDLGLWRMWPLFLLAPLALFLMLQLLQTAIKRDSTPSQLVENSVSGK